MLKYLQVFSWLCEILLLLADSSSCFFFHTLLSSDCISSRFLDGWNLLNRFYKLLNWSSSLYPLLIEHFSTFTWENHLLLCATLREQGSTFDWGKVWRKLSSSFDGIIFVMVSLRFTSILKWAIGWSLMIMLMKNASDFSLEKVMIRHQM